MPYVTVAEAALRLGVSQDTVRRRMKAGQLVAQQEPTPSGFRWLVEMPDDAGAPLDSASVSEATHAGAEALELERLRAEVAGLRELLDSVAGERDRSYARIEALERIAERAQILQERAQPAALPSETGDRSNHAGAGDTTHQGQPEGLLARLSRVLRLG